VLAPVLDGRVPNTWRMWLVLGHTLEAIAQDTLGDQAAAETALERALDLAEPNADLTPFLLYPAPGLLERHAGHRTAHASLLAEIRGLLAGRKLAPPPAGPRPPLEALSGSEVRVLRYLPTNLSMRQIAGELYVSHNTVRTHISHLYAKLGTHTRAEAVDRARALGLLAPSPLRVEGIQPAGVLPRVGRGARGGGRAHPPGSAAARACRAGVRLGPHGRGCWLPPPSPAGVIRRPGRRRCRESLR
jgi:LuxR family transcriptional regulator, maltose regulon positive regulatory protein